MAKTKKVLLEEAEFMGLVLDKSLTKKQIEKSIDEFMKKEVPSETPKPAEKTKKVVRDGRSKIPAADILKEINGFESAVAQLVYLEQKMSFASSQNRIIAKQYNRQKSIVNDYLNSLKVVV